MGLKKFFKKIGGWVKDKFHKGVNAVKKFGKIVKDKVVPIVKKGVNFINNTPIGGIVNSFTGGALDKANRILNYIPDGKVKDKLKDMVTKATDIKNNVVNEIDKRQDQAKDLISKGNNFIDKLKQATNATNPVIAPKPQQNM